MRIKEKSIIKNKKSKMKELAEKKAISLFEIAIMIISTFAFAFLIALATPNENVGIAKAQEQSFCCEKTLQGAWCQDAPESECDTSNGLRATPSSCEATSFCKLGCCYDSNEGTCAENTPEIVCSDARGAWSDSAECSISQCNLGCCVIETQAAFVSLVRCKKLSAFYGVDTDFRSTIKSEDACIAIAQSQDQGACVFEEDFTNTCKFTTRENCKETNATFYKDKLCTAEEFGTDCGATTKTTCIEGSDEVYFVDTCGNPANIYDSAKINDNDYWTNVYAKSESCGSTSSTGNADSASCGNCDYLAGSICSKSEFGGAKATYGDYVCKDLNCKDTSNGEDMQHGETWCAYDSETGQGKDAVGSRHYRHVCISGEETTEPCDDFRQQTCIQDSIETSTGESFSQAACRSNRWQDCIAQIEKEDCENTDKRDCIWTAGSESVENGTIGCAPDVPPGLDFWSSEGDAKGICAAATKTCEVKFEKGLLSGGWECKENCECLAEGWAQKQNSLCTGLGDCGGYVNYVGEYTDDGYEYTIDGDKRTLPETGSDVVTWTGKVIKALVSGRAITGFDTANLEEWLTKVHGAKIVPIDPPIATTLTKTAPATSVVKDATKGEALTAQQPAGIPSDAKVIFDGKNWNSLADGKLTTWDNSGKLLSSTTAIQSGSYWYAQDTTNLNNIKWYDSAGNSLSTSQVAPGETLADAVARGPPQPATPIIENPKVLGQWDLGFSAGHIINGAFLALSVYGAIKMLGQLIAPDDEETVNTLAESAALGIFAGKTFTGLFGEKGWLGGMDKFTGQAGQQLLKTWSLGIGVAIAVIYFVMNYKKEKTQTISFSCLPWQPTTGGDDCEKCNDELNGCSEYKCKSLGQACSLLNVGTEEEKCAWVNPKDVASPVISEWDEVLTDGYAYEDVEIRPPGLGMRIENTEATDGCIKAFTPLDFGVTTNEPTQCKIDFQHKAGDGKTNAFDSMTFWMGESNLFDYNHSQTLSLPGPNASEQSPLISDDGTFTLYIRCEDANGNFNEDEFAVRYCVEKGPDTTPPKITATSITTGMPVAYNTDNVSIEVYVNEPADCKWSKEDRDYSAMENAMSCAASVNNVNPDLSYTCSGMLTGIQNRQDNPFYFRCKDNPGAEESDRNVNAESYSLIIKGTEPLYITSAKPNNTIIYSSTTIANLSLEATTAFGYKDGEATCYYSRTGNSNDYVMFFNTDSYQHKQSQNLLTGNYTYYLKCIDLGGNTDNTTIKFNVSVDTTAPRVVRAYKDGGSLVVATDEDAICAYGTQTCSYTFTDGIAISTSAQKTHKIAWDADTTYYIKCKDKFENQPLPEDCNIVVKAYELG